MNLLDAIRSTLYKNISVEIIIVDKNSPDGTRNKVEQYIQNIVNIDNCKNNTSYTIQQYYQTISNGGATSIKVASQAGKNGLVSAILEGIEQTRSIYVAVMDADFSHPPEMISKMLIELEKFDLDVVVASRYVHGGSIRGWSIKRRLMSKIGTKISQYILGIKDVKDPMSGFFVFKRSILENFKIATSRIKIYRVCYQSVFWVAMGL